MSRVGRVGLSPDAERPPPHDGSPRHRENRNAEENRREHRCAHRRSDNRAFTRPANDGVAAPCSSRLWRRGLSTSSLECDRTMDRNPVRRRNSCPKELDAVPISVGIGAEEQAPPSEGTHRRESTRIAAKIANIGEAGGEMEDLQLSMYQADRNLREGQSVPPLPCALWGRRFRLPTFLPPSLKLKSQAELHLPGRCASGKCRDLAGVRVSDRGTRGHVPVLHIEHVEGFKAKLDDPPFLGQRNSFEHRRVHVEDSGASEGIP